MGKFERPPQSVIDATSHDVLLHGGPFHGQIITLSLGAEGYHAFAYGRRHTYWLAPDGETMNYDGITD